MQMAVEGTAGTAVEPSAWSLARLSNSLPEVFRMVQQIVSPKSLGILSTSNIAATLAEMTLHPAAVHLQLGGAVHNETSIGSQMLDLK